MEGLITFEDRIAYLNIHWTQKEIDSFTQRALEYLDILKVQPLIGKKGKIKGVRIGLLMKEVSLIYRVKPIKMEIELLSFVDNRQDPRRIKKYK
ncbi:MAG TPA: hypothetical protein VIM55_01425 [Mucilaginibacter sp.]